MPKKAKNVTINQSYHQKISKSDYHSKKNSPSTNQNLESVRRYQFKTQQKLENVLNEVRQRIDNNTLTELIGILSTSDNLLEVYQRFTTKYDEKILLVLKVIDYQTLLQFHYLDKHRLIDSSLSNSEENGVNNKYLQTQRLATQRQLSKLRLKSIDLHETSNINHFYKIYLLSNKSYYNFLKTWSLPFELILLDDESKIEKYIDDNDSKILLLGKGFIKSPKLKSYLETESPSRIFLHQPKPNNKHSIAIEIPNRELLIKSILELESRNEK